MTRLIHFPPYRLEPDNAQLWRGPDAVPLRRKSFDLLCFLAERPGQLVTKDQLLDALWPDTAVSDVVLKVCVNELRQALDDDARAPRFIETVHRRGYRFVATSGGALDAGSFATERAGGQAAASARSRVALRDAGLADRATGRTTPPAPAGRAADLARLAAAYRRALAGERQTVFVAGEAGIGKTTLLDAFLARIEHGDGDGDVAPWIARGQCVAQYGPGEPFLPLLEGIGRLCRGADGAHLIERLRTTAPEWLLQIGGLLDEEESDALRRRAGGTAPERMLRLLAEALEALSSERPVVVVLEDLHWSDHATVELIAHLAQRRDPARLLVLGSYRPVDVIVGGHPFRRVKQELALHRRCVELPLGFLDDAAVASHLAARFPDAALPPSFASWLHRRTDGSPLFMVSVLDDLIASGVLSADGHLTSDGDYARAAVPESLRQMIEQQVERLDAGDQALLEAASVAGVQLSAATLAAALDGDLLSVEETCTAWARRGQMLVTREREEWPDGTVAGGFAFVHSLYREHVYARIAPARRAWLHRRVGERLERAWGARSAEIAGELALHFERCGDHARAVEHLRAVGARAIRAGAYREAEGALDRAEALAEHLPDGAARATVAMALQLARGQVLMAQKGLAHADVRAAFERVRDLSEQSDDTASLAHALGGLWAYHHVRGHGEEMRAAASRLLGLAERVPLPPLEMLAHTFAGMTAHHTGEPRRALRHVERALATRSEHGPSGLVDLTTPCTSTLALLHLELGRPDRARDVQAATLARTRAHDNPLGVVTALVAATELLYLIDDAPGARRLADEGIDLAREHAFPLWLAILAAVRGWAVAAEEVSAPDRSRDATNAAVIEELASRVDEVEALGGNNLLAVLLAALGHAHARAGDAAEAAALLDRALAFVEHEPGHRHLSELHRVRGVCELLAARDDGRSARRASRVERAERALREAIDVARRQQAPWYELRAAADLGELLASRGDFEEPRALLAPLCARIEGGADLALVKRARALAGSD